MGSHSLPPPPADDYESTLSWKSTTSSTKPVKPVHGASKRARSSAAMIHHITHGTSMNNRQKRVRTACDRCRAKKIKCNDQLPCKQCKAGGFVCTAGDRKVMGYKQLPRGYTEVLDNTQLALIATIHKLYSMVRNGQQWDLGEPELNDRCQPVAYNIAQKLGCIRQNSDIDLPVYSVFPEDEAGMAEVTRQLEDQLKDQGPLKEIKDTNSSIYNRTEPTSSSKIGLSDFEQDYRKAAFGSKNNAMTRSNQSFTGSHDFDFAAPPSDMDATSLFPSQSPSVSNFPAWTLNKPQPTDLTMQFPQQASVMQNIYLLNQGPVESELGTIKPHVVSCPNPEVIRGMGDPMTYWL